MGACHWREDRGRHAAWRTRGAPMSCRQTTIESPPSLTATRGPGPTPGRMISTAPSHAAAGRERVSSTWMQLGLSGAVAQTEPSSRSHVTTASPSALSARCGSTASGGSDKGSGARQLGAAAAPAQSERTAMPTANVRPITPADPSVRILSRYDWLLTLHVLGVCVRRRLHDALGGARARVPNDEHARRAHAPADRAARRRARLGRRNRHARLRSLARGRRRPVQLLDGWIVAAFVLWLVAEEAIRREDLFFKLARRRAIAPAHPRAPSRRDEARSVFHSRRALTLHLVGSSALLGLLAVMIFKPGA